MAILRESATTVVSFRVDDGSITSAIGRRRAMFTSGHDYSRAQIHAELGGSTVSCLPTTDGVIVAACLTTGFSPQAPDVVLCGNGPRTSTVSALFARQRSPVPVFIKRGPNRWQYRGRFVVAHSFQRGSQFERFIAGSGRALASVSHVVLLVPAGRGVG